MTNDLHPVTATTTQNVDNINENIRNYCRLRIQMILYMINIDKEDVQQTLVIENAQSSLHKWS